MAAYVQDSIMLVGDSLTQGGWEPYGIGQRLAHVYARKLDVINRGFSGYNSVWGLPVFEQCFAKQSERQLAQKVRILAIWFGANDAAVLPSPQHCPLPQFIDNIRCLARMITSPSSPYHSPDTHVFLVTPPPVNTYQRRAELAVRDPPVALDREFEVTRKYAMAVKEVGEEEGLGVIDVWAKVWEKAGQEERALSRYLWDGLHLSRDGYDIVYDGFLDLVNEKCPELHPDRLQMVFSPWKEIHWVDPEESLLRRPAEREPRS